MTSIKYIQHDSCKEITDSLMSYNGKIIAFEIFALMHDISVKECLAQTDDSGMTMEFIGKNDREVLFVIPVDGSKRYFVAKILDKFFIKGIAVDTIGLNSIANWLSGLPFSNDGLFLV